MQLPNQEPPPPPPLPERQEVAPYNCVAAHAAQECLNDPFMVLRPWDGAKNGILWPYCTLCNNWSDLAHINSQRHTKRLAQNSFVTQSSNSTNRHSSSTVIANEPPSTVTELLSLPLLA